MTPSDRTDRLALRKAVEIAKADAKMADLIDRKLADGQPWPEVAKFAAGCCQSESLQLRPWMVPPVDISDIEDALSRPAAGDIHQVNAAARLLQKMLALGVSRFDPDPVASLAEAERTPA